VAAVSMELGRGACATNAGSRTGNESNFSLCRHEPIPSLT
jgi:hypothetical protein